MKKIIQIFILGFVFLLIANSTVMAANVGGSCAPAGATSGCCTCEMNSYQNYVWKAGSCTEGTCGNDCTCQSGSVPEFSTYGIIAGIIIIGGVVAWFYKKKKK